MKSELLSKGILCAVFVVVLIGTVSNVFAQFPEDALRLSMLPNDALRLATPGIGVGARALGMGNAYTGVASDYSAIYWNPAGLAQAEHGEFFLGMSFLNNKDNGTLAARDGQGNVTDLGSPMSYTSNVTALNALGVVYPVPVRRGSLVFAFGYNRGSDFVSGTSYSGFNPKSTIIQAWAPDRQPADTLGIAWNLYLTNRNPANNTYTKLFDGMLTQLGTVLQSGGLNNYSVSGATDVAKNLSVGITLTFLSGSYRLDRTYQEQDNQHNYSAPNDLRDVTLGEFTDWDINGGRAKFGLLYRVPEKFRLGFGIQTPTTFTVKDNNGLDATSHFYTVDTVTRTNTYGPISDRNSSEYDVHTPWVFSAGASVILRDLVLSGDIDYTDWTQLEFANGNSDLLAMNKDFKTLFRDAVNLRAGAEYDIREIGLRVRGGFIYNQSPFQGNPSSFDQKYITGGLGFMLGESAMLDIAYAHGWWKTFRLNYLPDYSVETASSVEESVGTNTFMLTLVFRY
jgi:hypothetical protein